jgi:hypothetical protein
MFDLTSEHVISLTEATRRLPPGRKGRGPHLSTLIRWIVDGARGPAGVIVRLEALRLGGRWVTSDEALQRFAERLTPDLTNCPSQVSHSPAARQRASERAARQLEKLGI